MKKFDVSSFLASEGFELINQEYTEMPSSSKLTVKVKARPINKTTSVNYFFTFWLFKMPNGQPGEFDIWMSCFKREPAQE